MNVGVLGGGMQGCCVALALAERGVRVTLFDRNDRLLSRTAIANEGKVHLGYMYANDPSYSTARMMMRGALAFAPFFARTLGRTDDAFLISRPAAYVVHRESQRPADQVRHYMEAVHAMLLAESHGRPGAYFGRDLRAKPRIWSDGELAAEFDTDVALAAFDTDEVAIDPGALARSVSARIEADSRIEVRLSHEVLAVDDVDCPIVLSSGPGGKRHDRFDHVVNALWEGRLAVDSKLGMKPLRPWLHRLKYGVSFRLPPGSRLPPSATFVSGPFGEVVSYADGLTYLTWYPVCLLALSDEVTPPDWPTYPGEPLSSALASGTLEAMGTFVNALADVDEGKISDKSVRGGAIVAWGETDIYDPESELHRRSEIGVTSTRRYHSVDPGKITMAPYFADVCAERILGEDFRA
jgi:glycine/D-amino acid oxidase-like deaminating enzyme